MTLSGDILGANPNTFYMGDEMLVVKKRRNRALIGQSNVLIMSYLHKSLPTIPINPLKNTFEMKNEQPDSLMKKQDSRN